VETLSKNIPFLLFYIFEVNFFKKFCLFCVKVELKTNCTTGVPLAWVWLHGTHQFWERGTRTHQFWERGTRTHQLYGNNKKKVNVLRISAVFIAFFAKAQQFGTHQLKILTEPLYNNCRKKGTLLTISTGLFFGGRQAVFCFSNTKIDHFNFYFGWDQNLMKILDTIIINVYDQGWTSVFWQGGIKIVSYFFHEIFFFPSEFYLSHKYCWMIQKWAKLRCGCFFFLKVFKKLRTRNGVEFF